MTSERAATPALGATASRSVRHARLPAAHREEVIVRG